MSGILLILVASIWFFIVRAIYREKFKGRKFDKKTKTKAALFWLIVFPLPIADEIIGGSQLWFFCQISKEVSIDAERIKGKTVELIFTPSRGYEIVSRFPLKIEHVHISFQDVLTHEEYAFSDWYSSAPGWMRRLAGISDGAGCVPSDFGNLSKIYGFKKIN